jgi:hypothetical protein
MKRSTAQPQILHFFKKQKDIAVPNEETEKSVNLDHIMDQMISSSASTLSEVSVPLFDRAPSSISSAPPIVSYNPNDIGHFIFQVDNMDDVTKYNIIKSSWKPPPTFKFPFSLQKKRDTEVKRYINHNHLNCHEWLVYSDIEKGLFCKYCVVFSDFCGKNKAKVEKFVLKPLTSFAKLTGKEGDLKIHENTLFHQNCVVLLLTIC